MKLPHKTLERKLFDSGYEFVIGIDEVGMACLAGPVYVCAVLFTPEFFQKTHKKLHWLRDSKMLLPHQREKFFNELIKEKNIKFQIANCSPKTIDKINIYQAARLAMRRAVRGLIKSRSNLGRIKVRPLSCIVLVDGKTKIQGRGLDQLDQLPIVKGDRKIFSIACASIIAKVSRDRVMAKYAKKFPAYGFEKHKGYPTKEHQAKLVKFGPCVIHRRSFAPVAKLI